MRPISVAMQGVSDISRTAVRLLALSFLTVAVVRAGEPSWPCWRGPFGNGSGVECRERLVDDLSNAVEVWSCALPETGHTGWADLAVAEGRVYAFLFRPGGGLVHADTLAAARARGSRAEQRRRALLLADDVIQCMDAATGRALWRREYRAKGANHRLICGWSPQCTPCVADGRLYALGSMGRLYCMDARTGRPLWESDLGPQKRLVERNLLRANPRFEYTASGGHSEQFVSCPLIAGDGRVDLLSWDGRTLRLVAQAADGTFAAARECGTLPECLSLECADSGAGAAVVVGRAAGPLLLVRGATGAFRAQPLAAGPGKDALARLGGGGLCVTADVNGDGHGDVLSLYAKGTVLYAGAGPGRFRPAAVLDVRLVGSPCAALCGDYNADGRLDVIVAGKGGMALLTREGDANGAAGRPIKMRAKTWHDATHITGELTYHGNQNRQQVTACVPCSPNTDGRQGLGVFYTGRKPLMFFNRGFACFGWARELDLGGAGAGAGMGMMPPDGPPAEKARRAVPDDLQRGQAAGAILDLTGDAVADMLAVGRAANEVWMVRGQRDGASRCRTGLLFLPAGQHGPMTVTVRDKGRVAGMYVVRAGMPASVSRSRAGPLTVTWAGVDGKAQSRQIVLTRDGARFELTPTTGGAEPAAK